MMVHHLVSGQSYADLTGDVSKVCMPIYDAEYLINTWIAVCLSCLQAENLVLCVNGLGYSFSITGFEAVILLQLVVLRWVEGGALRNVKDL